MNPHEILAFREAAAAEKKRREVERCTASYYEFFKVALYSLLVCVNYVVMLTPSRRRKRLLR